MAHDNSKRNAEVTDQLEKDSQEGKMSARNSKLFEKENEEVKQNLMSNDEEENDASGVKYIAANSINGDAKINIENVKVAFAGMGKEELMKFANDPFWVRVRWTLFILFWLLWIGMLASAIAIVVVAPKCAAPAPLKWWEQGPLYKVDVASFNEDLKGLESKVNYIKELGVKGIILESVLKSSVSPTKSVVDFKQVDPVFGTLETFKNLTSKIKEAGMHLVLSLVPNYSSEQHSWFNMSVNKVQPYTDYYVWASGSVDSNGNKMPPNNWLSVNGNSAWMWNDMRQQYYLHQFDGSQPDLNFENDDVMQEFKDIFSFWLEQGASGFVLEKVDYLLEDAEKKNESPFVGSINVTHDSYDFYSHYRTTNHYGLEGLLAEWKELVVNKTGEDGLFVAGRVTSLEPFTKNASDLLLNPPDLFSVLKTGFSAQALLNRTLLQLHQSGNESRPAWQLGRLAARLGDDYVDPLNMVAVMLPGTPVFLAGEELGQDLSSLPLVWEKSNTTAGDEDRSVEAQRTATHSHLLVFKQLAKLREEQSVMHGNYSLSLVNSTVFTITWLKSSNPGYMLAFNPTSSNVTVDLTTIQSVPNDLTVHTRSKGFVFDEKDKTSHANAVTFPPRGAAVFTFVPKKNE